MTDALRPGLSVIIVSYNVREYLDACLQSVLHAAQKFSGTLEVIVFDNDSRDGTLALLRPRYPTVNWLSSDRNLGFGSGCNRGAAVATQPLLLFLNPDTIVSEDTFTVMWDFFQQQENIGVAGCKIVNRDGSLQLACKRSFPSPKVAAFKLIGLSALFPQSRIFGRYNLTFLDQNQTHEVDAVSGSFLCVNRDLYQQIHGFDEEFFMYGEDLDICFRIKLLGKRNYYHPATKVIHFKGESAKSRPLRSFFYFYEAMVIFSKKHFELRVLPFSLFYLGIFILALVNFASERVQKWQRWLVDLLLVNGVLAMVNQFYMHLLGQASLFFYNRSLYWFWHALVSVFVFIPMVNIGEYGRRMQSPAKVFWTLCISFLSFFSVSFFMKEEAYSRVVFGFTALLCLILLPGWRLFVQHGGRFLSRIMGANKRVAIIGVNEKARQLALLIEADQLPGYEFLGFIPVNVAEINADMKANIIGDLNALAGLINKVDLHQVIIAGEESSYETALSILAKTSRGKLDVKMLVGDPMPGSISLIDLDFGK